MDQATLSPVERGPGNKTPFFISHFQTPRSVLVLGGPLSHLQPAGRREVGLREPHLGAPQVTPLHTAPPSPCPVQEDV